MNEEYQFIDTAGWTYTVDDIDRILQTALDNKEIPVNTSFEKWLKKEGFKVHKVAKKEKKALEHITREAFDNIPEEQLVPTLQAIYGKDLDISQATVGRDAIKVKDKKSNIEEIIKLNTDWNRDPIHDAVLTGGANEDAYQQFIDLVNTTELTSPYYTDPSLDSDAVKIRKSWKKDRDIEHVLLEIDQVDLDMPIYSTPKEQASWSRANRAIDTTPLELTSSERIHTVNDIQSIAQSAWAKILTNPSSYGLNEGDLNRLSDIKHLDLSHKQKLYYQGIVYEEVSNLLAAQGLHITEDDFIANFSQGSSTYRQAQETQRSVIASNNFKATANANVASVTQAYLDNITNAQKANYINIRPESAPRIENIEKLKNITSDMTALQQHIRKLEQGILDGVGKEGDEQAVVQSTIQYNTLLTEFKKIQNSMEEPVLYDYTGNRPEDVDENTWKRKQEATKLIELETGVPLNELENLEGYYNNLKKQRVIRQENAANQMITLDLDKLNPFPKEAILKELLSRGFIDTLNQTGEIEMSLFDYTSINLINPNWSEFQGWDADALEEGIFFGPESSVFGYGHILPGLDADEMRTVLAYNEFLLDNQDKSEILFERIYVQPDLQKMEDNIGFWETGIDTAEQTGFFGMGAISRRESGRGVFFKPDGLLEGRVALDMYREVIDEVNYAMEDSGVPGIEFTPRELEALAVDAWGAESWGTVSGGFVPIIADLAASVAMIETGLGAVTGLANIAKTANRAKLFYQSVDKIRKLDHTSKGINKVLWYTTRGLKMEAETKLAGFDWGSGATFSTFGLATRNIKLFSKFFPDSAVMIDGAIKAALGGAAAAELAGITEASIRAGRGQEGFNQWWAQSYGSFSEVTQRVIQNAVLFKLYGTYKPTLKALSGDPASRALFRSSRQNANAQMEITSEIENLKALQKENPKDKTIQDRIDLLEDTSASIMVVEMNKMGGFAGISGLREVKDAEGNITREVDPNFVTETQKRINTLTQRLGGNPVKVIYDPLMKDKGGYKFEGGELKINPKAEGFNQGVIPHEVLVHYAIRSRLEKSGPEVFAKWGDQLQKGINEIFADSGIILENGKPLDFGSLSQGIKETYGKKNAEGKWEMNEALKNEETLAFFVELMAMPNVYFSTVGKGAMKNMKNQWLSLLENTGLKKYDLETIKNMSNVQALEIMARLVRDMQFGRSGGEKIMVAANLDKLRDPFYTTREGVRRQKGELALKGQQELKSKEIDLDISKENKRIAKENKRLEDLIIAEGAWKITEIENKALAKELKNALIQNNLGLVNKLANQAFNNPNVAGLEAGLKIPLKDWQQGYKQQLVEMINTYEPIPQDGSSKGKQVPFGAYIAQNLHRRYGNILNIEKGKLPEMAGRIEGDIIAEEVRPEVVGDLVLAKELKIKNKVITEFEKTLLEEIKDLETLDQLTYKEFRALWPKGVVGEIFGTTRAERLKTFKDKAKTIMASWPETNQTRGGESLGVGSALLNFMYGKGTRAKMSEGASGAGLPERIKQEKSAEELINFLGGPNVGYTTSQARIKSAINLTLRGLATQLIADPTKIKMTKAIQDFGAQDIKVKEVLSKLEQVFTKEFDRIDTARERGEILELRESDINQAIKRVDRALDQYTSEARGRIREGLAPELASKDIGILKPYWEKIKFDRPRTLTKLKDIIGKDNWDKLTATSQDLLITLTKAYSGILKDLDALYMKYEAAKLGIPEAVYKAEFKDQIQGYKDLSLELGTKDKTIPSLRTDAGARAFAKKFLQRLPNFDNLSSDMQQKVITTMGFGDHGGGFITNGKGFTFEGQNIKKGQYSKLLTRVFGEGWKSKNYVTNHWKTSFSPKQWGAKLNSKVAEILKSDKLDSIKYQELEALFKKEGIDFDSTVKANLKVLADVYKALEGAAKDMVREGKDVTEALQAVQDFLKPQTNRARGLLKTLVPVLFVETAPKKGINKYKKKAENYYTEHMRELFNANKTFIRDLKRSLEGEFSQTKFDTRLTKNINDLMQGLVGARTSEIKDAKGTSYQWYYNPILSITMGGRKTWDTTINLGGNNIYNPTTLADMIFNTATRQTRRLIEGTANSELTTIGVLVKQHIKNKTQYETARIRNIKLNRNGNTLYSKDLSNGEYLSTLKNRDKALELAREKDKKTKGISVFDFDDTLAKTKSKVIVYAPAFEPGTSKEVSMRLTPAEFAKRHAELERMGASFDFSEFNKVLGGKKGPLFDLAVKRQGKFGTGDIYILTARPQEAAPAIHAFLKGMGLDIPLENIIGLENGSPVAKSDWILKKAAEGYNDFYFADDVRPNVKAVQDVLNVIDVKSKVQQVLKSQNLGKSFNKVLEESFGIERFKDYSQTKARTRGAKHKESWWLPASASDLPLMMDRIAGKGKQGEAHQKLFNQSLYQPFARAEKNLTESTLSIYRDFKGLQTQFKGATSQLKKKIGDYSIEQAIRVRNWTTLGIEIPGLSKRDSKLLNDKVNKDPELSAFADQIISIQKGQYAKPAKYWEAGGLFMDINNTLKTDLRRQYLKEWKDNVDAIFTPEFYNKLEAVQGPKYVESLKNMLGRMWRGSNRTGKESRLETKMLNFLNNATAAIMFLNTRTAVLQTISSFNYINWTDNNPLKAAARFANLPQYVKDWNRLMNSDWAIARRKGLRINIQEAELVETLQGARDKGQAMLGWLLREGFILTKMGDTFATATGGATFYRNRINTYKKQGLSEKAAEQKAYQDWVELSEENQQSARMDRISMQQATPLGRVILAFANTPMQYARLQKRAYMDLINGRGDAKTNISKIVYYAFVQNLMFNALQNALFTELYNDPGVADDKTIRIANGMVDGILRGGGITGSGVAMLKNVGLKLYTESEKKRPKYSNASWELLGISPPLKSKVGKVRSGFAALEYNMKDIKTKGFSLDNPAYLSAGQLVSGFTNVPLDRVIIKLQNIQEAMNEELQWYERMALLGGWKDWELGIKEGETAKYFGDEFDLEKRQKEIIKQTNSDWLFKTGNP